MKFLTVIIQLMSLNVIMILNTAITDSKGTSNNSRYATKYYRRVGYIYAQPPIDTLVMSMAAFDLEIAAVQCLFTCQKEDNSTGNSNCVAVNFNTENGTCQLLSEQPIYKYNNNVLYAKSWTLYTEKPAKYPRDCEDIPVRKWAHYYHIQPDNEKPPFPVLCGTGIYRTTSILSHTSSSQFDFQRGSWAEYKHGILEGHGKFSYFWIGNDNFHTLTNSREYTIRFWCRSNETVIHKKSYSSILVGSEADFYRINIGNITDTNKITNDAIWATATENQKINGSIFLTHENVSRNACAREGGWWYNNCTNANFNTANDNMFWGSTKCTYTRIRVYRKKP